MKRLLDDLYSEELEIKINVKVKQLTRRFANLHIILHDSFHNDNLMFETRDSYIKVHNSKTLNMRTEGTYNIDSNNYVNISVRKHFTTISLYKGESKRHYIHLPYIRQLDIELDLTGEY